MALAASTAFAEEEWAGDPDAVKVFRVCAKPTAQGTSCLVHVILEYSRGGVPLGKREITLSPGFIADPNLKEDFGETTFEDFWAMVPDAEQTVKDAILAKLPKKALQQAWLGRKL